MERTKELEEMMDMCQYVIRLPRQGIIGEIYLMALPGIYRELDKLQNEKKRRG